MILVRAGDVHQHKPVSRYLPPFKLFPHHFIYNYVINNQYVLDFGNKM